MTDYKIGEGVSKAYNLEPPKEEVKEGLIDKALPTEMFEKCLSYLDGLNLQQANSVSRLWSERAIDTAKHEEFSKIKDFATFICENLKASDANPIKELFEVKNENKILNSVNLIQVKTSIHELKEKFLNILKNVDEEDLNKLEQLSKDTVKPKFFENVFSMAGIYKKIDQANHKPSDGQRDFALYQILNDVVKSDNVSEIIEVVNMIPDKENKNRTFEKICQVLTKRGDLDKAIEVANMISDADNKGSALQDLPKKLAKNGNLDKAIEIANMIPDTDSGKGRHIRNLAFQDISGVLAQRGDIDKAIQVANMVPDSDRGDALEVISRILLELNGDIDKAIEVANMIPDKDSRDSILQEISGRAGNE